MGGNHHVLEELAPPYIYLYLRYCVSIQSQLDNGMLTFLSPSLFFFFFVFFDCFLTHEPCSQSRYTMMLSSPRVSRSFVLQPISGPCHTLPSIGVLFFQFDSLYIFGPIFFYSLPLLSFIKFLLLVLNFSFYFVYLLLI